MKKCRSLGTVAVLSLGLFSSQALAQDFCNASHSGTKVDVSNTAPTGDANGKGTIGTIGDYSYEEWNIPTWHERLKPSYYELQKYLEKYRTENKKK